MSLVRINKINCPKCGMAYNLASHSGPSKQPKPGDYGMCLYCGAITIFDEKLAVVIPSPKQLAVLQSKPFWDYVAGAQKIIRKKRAIEQN